MCCTVIDFQVREERGRARESIKRKKRQQDERNGKVRKKTQKAVYTSAHTAHVQTEYIKYSFFSRSLFNTAIFAQLMMKSLDEKHLNKNHVQYKAKQKS